MDIVATATNAFVVAAVGALLYWLSRGRFAELKDEIKELRAETNHRFELVDRRFELVDRRFELVMTELAAVRSDLTHVALAVGARTRPEANPA